LIPLIWLARAQTHGGDGPLHLMSHASGASLFLGVYAELVVGLRVWSKMLSRRIGGDALGRSLHRFNVAIEAAKYFVPAWLMIGIYGGLGWGATIDGFLKHPFFDQTILPKLLVGVAPALLAWMGLWWADYPAERAMRESQLALDLDQGLPVHSPPTFSTIFLNNFRLQILFTLGPILMVLLAHDLVTAALAAAHVAHAEDIGSATMLVAVGLIYLLSPELLRRTIPTERLPDSPLRRRLESLCRRAGIRYRDILVWKTRSSLGNAMVMGLFPRVRYVLMSDLLLERMTDDKIEAVFAHEMGHAAHRHLWWYVAYFALFIAIVAGPVAWILNLTVRHLPSTWLAIEGGQSLGSLIMTLIAMGIFVLTFTFFSQRLERQADVFAARMMQLEQPAIGAGEPLPPRFADTYVGEYGAGLFASALREVAHINRMPLRGGNWLHGSIQSRMNYLYNLSGDRARTTQFDRKMGRLFVVLLLSLAMCGTWGAMQTLQGPQADTNCMPIGNDRAQQR
jgi:STE24 endopeptidase